MKNVVTPKKSLGQNFLVDKNILQLIVEAAKIGSSDIVFEVGPGLGALTTELARGAKSLICIEKDERLKAALTESLVPFTNIELIFTDALEFPWSEAPENSLFVSNLPYYISTAIIGQVLASGRFKRLLFLVQREVAKRIVAKAGDPDYGFLSGLVALAGKAKIIRHISPNAFWPPPEVTSSLVEIEVFAIPERKVVRMLEIVLQHRRKTLKNNLLMAGFPANLIEETLSKLNIPPQIRGEKLNLEIVKALSDEILA